MVAGNCNWREPIRRIKKVICQTLFACDDVGWLASCDWVWRTSDISGSADNRYHHNSVTEGCYSLHIANCRGRGHLVRDRQFTIRWHSFRCSGYPSDDSQAALKDFIEQLALVLYMS